MPGLVGLVTRMPRPRAEAELERMLRTMQHEPFYTTGTWSDPSLGVYVGWTARAGSFCDCMPVVNETRDVTLVFSGEDFPDPDLRQALKARGHEVMPDGPSYLVHVYEEDERFPRMLNGRFHGLAADSARGTAVLFNDRTGMHRLYYHLGADAVYFAAEAKAILAVRPELRRLDPKGMGEWISCGCVLENRSLFPGIQVLPGGSRWRFRQGRLEAMERYFDPREWEEQPALDAESYYQDVRRTFARILPRYFASREPVGLSLTGGLDTRMIMAWHRPPPGALPCYTFGGTYRASRDVRVSAAVARACGQPHAVIGNGDAFLARFASYAERSVYWTDGCVDVTRSVDLHINEAARQIAPVRMTGNYGGELLRSVRAFKPIAPAPGVFSPGLTERIEEARHTYTAAAAGHPLTFAVFKQGPWHFYGSLALEETQLALRSPYLDSELVRLAYRGPASSFKSDALCLRLIADGDAALSRIPTDRAGAGMRRRLDGLAHEFLFKAEYAYDYGMPNWLAAADHRLRAWQLERLFLGRHKFSHYRIWYRDQLAPYVAEMLLDRQTLSRSYLEAPRVREMVARHLKGDRNYTREIHKLLSLELIHRQLIDVPIPADQPAVA